MRFGRHNLARFFAFALCCVFAPALLSYEVPLHREMSEAAFNKALSEHDFLADLGVEASEELLGNVPRDWVKLGSHREDTESLERPILHFYDPTTGNGLLGEGKSSLDWAFDQVQELTNLRAIPAAREAMYLALTDQASNVREQSGADLFRIVGHVIHLVQDLATPEHVRDDAHLSISSDFSRYEKYTGASKNFTKFSFDAYPSVRFSEYRHYWKEGAGKGLAELTNANFVSQDTNFQSQAYASGKYSLPRESDTVEAAPVEAVVTLDGLTFTVPVRYRSYTFTDPVTGAQVTNEFLTAHSIFDFVHNERHGVPVYTLHDNNHKAYGERLVPRAVGYSAGFIEYFFRGRLEAVDAAFTDTGVSLKVRNAIDKDRFPEWKNEVLHSRDSQGNAGQFVLTVTYKQGQVEQFDASPPVTFPSTSPQTLNPGDTSSETLSFILSAPPDDATEVEYRLVFRGRLGEEDDAVAVGTIKPLGGFLVQPSYVPNDGISGTRLIERIRGEWRLTTDEGLVAGNIDWRGFVNGKPTKVLTWQGPSTRYFPKPSSFDFGPSIFQNGERFAIAPFAVLGAAITKDAAGEEWLLAICNSGGADVVFRRPNIKSSSSALFDPIDNPDGWQEIGNFPYESGFKSANRPWFFNGAGTVAQTMREDDTDVLNGLTRLKITVTGNTASIDNLGNLEGETGTDSSPGVTVVDISPGVTRCAGVTVVDDDDVSFARNWSGNYIVAVDYKDDQEILATIDRSVDGESAGRFDRTEDVSIACGGDGRPDLITHVIVARRESTIMQDSTTTLSFGTTQIVLNSNTVNSQALIMLDRVIMHDFTGGGVDTTDIHSTVNTYTSSDETEDTNIIYLDMRNDLVVLRSRRSTTTETGGGEAIVWAITSQNTTEEKVEIRWPQGTIPVFDSTSSSTFTFPDGFRPNFIILGGLPFERPIGPRTMGGLVGAQHNQGVWAVSNGNLLVSQEYQDENSETQHFNFLTDGNLEALIPGAPADAHYFPGGVVK